MLIFITSASSRAHPQEPEQPAGDPARHACRTHSPQHARGAHASPDAVPGPLPRPIPRAFRSFHAGSAGAVAREVSVVTSAFCPSLRRAAAALPLQ